MKKYEGVEDADISAYKREIRVLRNKITNREVKIERMQRAIDKALSILSEFHDTEEIINHIENILKA